MTDKNLKINGVEVQESDTIYLDLQAMKSGKAIVISEEESKNNMTYLLKDSDLDGIKMASAIEIREGIYFGMPEEQYHALPYFSRSFADEVLCDLEEADYRRNNPVEQTPAMALGVAIHAKLLEPKKFDQIYELAIRIKDYEEKGITVLKTNDDLSTFLASVGEKKSGKKEELIARALPFIDPAKFVIWESECLKQLKRAIEYNKRILDDGDSKTIQGIKESYEKRTQIQKILSGGYSEVTIIWRDEETSIMCKCRLDYVRPEAIGEVKSFSMKYKKPLMEYLFKEIVMQKYNFQFAVYSEALETIIKKIRGNKAKVYGEVDAEWLKKFLENSRKQFFIVFCRTAAPYQIRAIELERGVDGAQSNSYYQIPRDMWRMALNKYDRATKSGIWTEKEVETLDDIHVPSVMYQAPIY